MRRIKLYFALTALTAVILAAAVSFLPIFSALSDENVYAEELPASALAVEYNVSMPANTAESAIVIDAESLSVLYSKNADQRRGMASTTKIMTALIAIENCYPDDEFSIPKEAVGIEGSSVYLVENEPLTMRELLYCLMLESGNDAATAIAICCGGSLDDFVGMMNERAEELGLTSTHFSNPHGLSSEEHYTTARELATITAEAMKYPLFREIVSTKTAKVRYNGVAEGRSLTNHNKLLFGYEGSIGVKTGYTKADGRCLVSASERNGMTIITVTLGDSSPTVTHRTLSDAAFENFEQVQIADIGEIYAEIPIVGGDKEFITVCNAEKITLCLPKGAQLQTELILPDTLNAPIEAGEIIAQAKFITDGTEVYITNLESVETVNIKKKTFWEKLFGE